MGTLSFSTQALGDQSIQSYLGEGPSACSGQLPGFATELLGLRLPFKSGCLY